MARSASTCEGGEGTVSATVTGAGPTAANPRNVSANCSRSRNRIRTAEHEHEQVPRQLAREVRLRRRLGRALVAAGVLSIVALVGGALAIVGQRHADDARRRATDAAVPEIEARQAAEAAEARAEDGAQAARLVTESERELDSRLDLAMLLAVEAHRRVESPETSTALFSALTHNLPAYPVSFDPASGSGRPSSFIGFLAGPEREQTDVDVSDDGRIVASGGENANGEGGLTLVFDTGERREIGQHRERRAHHHRRRQ